MPGTREQSKAYKTLGSQGWKYDKKRKRWYSKTKKGCRWFDKKEWTIQELPEGIKLL